MYFAQLVASPVLMPPSSIAFFPAERIAVAGLLAFLVLTVAFYPLAFGLELC